MSDTLPPPLDPPEPVEPRLFDEPLAPESPPTATVSLDTAEVSATQALYQAAIGPINTPRYLQLFTRFEAADRVVPSWNWAGSLCTLGWMLFRRMGLAALVYFGVAAALLLAAGVLVALVFRDAPELQWGVGLATALLLFLVPGILADTWLYTHTRKRMARALADSANWTEAAALLGRQAVAWPHAAWIALAHAGVLGGLAAAWLSVPGLQGPLGAGAPAARQLQEVVPHAGASAPASAGAAAVPAPVASGPGAMASAPVAAPSVAVVASSAAVMGSGAASAPAPAMVSASAPVAGASQAALAAMVTSAPRPAASMAAPSAAASTPNPTTVPALTKPAPAATTTASATASEKASAKASAKAGAAAPRASAAAAAKPAAAPARSTPAAARPAPTAARPLLNVGLFAVESNARAAHARLRAAGLPATVEEVQTRNGPRFRVRAGPFASPAAADAAARRIRAMGLEAQIVRTAAAAAER